MFDKIKKWVTKNKLLSVVLFIVIMVYLNGYFRFTIETFAIADMKVKDINNALDSLIACQNTDRCTGDNVIANFAQFKEKLGYPNFSVVLFNDLLNKRKDKEEHLTREEIVFLVEEGKYESSFEGEKKTK
jgi:hypothetical protein